MSTIVMSACWPLQMGCTEKAVLISLADNANDHGHSWPSIAVICERTCLSRSTVLRCIANLERSKLLAIVHGRGRNVVNQYTINLEKVSEKNVSQKNVSEKNVSESQGTVLEKVSESEKKVSERHTEPSLRATIKSKIKSNRQTRVRAQACPIDVEKTVWNDWLNLRKAKHAPVSATVITRARSEAVKAGMTFSEFLAEWCERGSQGLKAEWITSARRDNARGPPRPPIAQQFSDKTYTGTPDDELPSFLQPSRNGAPDLPEARRV